MPINAALPSGGDKPSHKGTRGS